MSKLQVNDIVNKDDDGSVGFSKGAVVTGVATATTFKGALEGNVTGDVTGNADTATTATNAQGLTGTPDITVNNAVVGVITATTYVGVPEGTNILKAMLFV
tara:strand:+ start:643 stop:945 length:303 start_codon:yes stop_codon:yes gene_type:complete